MRCFDDLKCAVASISRVRAGSGHGAGIDLCGLDALSNKSAERSIFNWRLAAACGLRAYCVVSFFPRYCHASWIFILRWPTNCKPCPRRRFRGDKYSSAHFNPALARQQNLSLNRLDAATARSVTGGAQQTGGARALQRASPQLNVVRHLWRLRCELNAVSLRSLPHAPAHGAERLAQPSRQLGATPRHTVAVSNA